MKRMIFHISMLLDQKMQGSSKIRSVKIIQAFKKSIIEAKGTTFIYERVLK